MIDKEVDVLIDYIVENDVEHICTMLSDTDFCEKHCGEGQAGPDEKCVREYARLKAKECEE